VDQDRQYKTIRSPSYPPLTDIQDQVGSVSLHELCMPQQIMGGDPERVDAAAFLLRKQHVSIHTKEAEGVSPFQMFPELDQMNGTRGVAKLVMEAATNDESQKTKQIILDKF